MKTILYLGNSYCSDLSDLKNIIAASPSQDSLLAKEIFCSFKDGTMQKWLEEGTDHEKEIASKLPHISDIISDSELMRRLGECFEAKYKTRSLALSDYIVLDSVKGAIAPEAFKNCSLKGYSLNPPKDQNSKVRFCFHFKTEKTIGENVTFTLRLVTDVETSATSEKNMLNLRDIGKSIDIDLNVLFPLNLSKTQHMWIELIAEFMNTEIVLWKCSVTNGQTFKIGDVEFEMIGVEGETFWMGAQSGNPSGQNYDPEAENDEFPVHQVTLSDFSIGKYPVTQRLWKAVMGSNPSYLAGDLSRPVENVSWDDITNEFLPKLNELLKDQLDGRHFILPSEAQWEYAARGGNKSKGFKYSGSDHIDDVAWYYDNSGNTTHPVGRKKPNELGLYDMSGNVCEWCSDWYGDYSSSSQTDPAGLSTGSNRVLRGGYWNLSARFCRVSLRGIGGPDNGDYNFGFRLVLVPAFN